MSEGPIQRMWSRRPRRHVRRVATLQGKFPGEKPRQEETNPQTPFVLSPRSRRAARRARTTIVVNLTDSDLNRIPSSDEPQPVDITDDTEA